MATGSKPTPAVIAKAAADIAPAIIDAIRERTAVEKPVAEDRGDYQPPLDAPETSSRGQFTASGARRFLRTVGIVAATLVVSKLARLESDQLSELLSSLVDEGAIPAGVVGLANFAFQLWRKDDPE